MRMYGVRARRVNPQGNRSCKHTAMIDMGTADSNCKANKDYMEDEPIKQAPKKARKVQPVIETEESSSEGVARKITWQ